MKNFLRNAWRGPLGAAWRACRTGDRVAGRDGGLGGPLGAAWRACSTASLPLLHLVHAALVLAPHAVEALHDGNYIAASLDLLVSLSTFFRSLRQLLSALRDPDGPDGDATAPVPPKK